MTIVISTPEARGGAIRAGLQLGDELAEIVDGDIAKMEGKHDKDLEEELDLNTDVIPLPARTEFRDVASVVNPSDRNHENVLIWTSLIDNLQVTDYDLVHIHNPVPIGGMVSVAVACRRAEVPYCVTTHGIRKVPTLPDQLEMNGLNTAIYNWSVLKPYKWVLRNAAHLFALSDGDKKLLQNMFPGQSISVTGNGVPLNPPMEEAGSIRDRLDINRSKPLVLFVGKLMASKGVDDLLCAFEKLDVDCTLVIIGDEVESGYAERIATMDENSVKYLGYVDKKTLNLLYQSADLFAFPTRSDVYPLCILEALASRTPVISTSVGGIPEQLSDDCGVIIPPNSPDRLATELTALITDERRRTQLSGRAMQRAREQFSWERVAISVATEYQRFLNQ